MYSQMQMGANCTFIECMQYTTYVHACMHVLHTPMHNTPLQPNPPRAAVQTDVTKFQTRKQRILRMTLQSTTIQDGNIGY